MSSNPRSSFLPTGFTASPASIDPEVWATCAGPLLRIPPVGSLAVYCPLGDAEQRLNSIDAARDLASRIPHPPQLLCQVLSVTLQASERTEELSARYRLRTVSPACDEAQRIWEAASPDLSGEDAWIPPPRMGSEHAVWKVLSRSDIYGQGGLAVPKRAAEMCLPPLDMEMDQPSQNVAATDLFGNQWAFRHVIRGRPLRNLLTTNWNRFVAQKRLQAPDRIVLIRGETGRLKIGLRRSQSVESPAGRAGGSQKPRPVTPGTLASAESIFHESRQAAMHEGSVFQVVYRLQPHSNASFVVPLDTFCKGLKQQRLLTPGRSLKMAFETMEFGVRRFRGQIVENDASSQAPSEFQLHDLPTQWRCIQVEWADSDPLMPKPSRVSPWDVALASTDQGGPLSPPVGAQGPVLPREPTLELPARTRGAVPPAPAQSQGQLHSQARSELLSGPQGQVLGLLGIEQLLAGQAVAAGVLGALRTAHVPGQLQTQSQEHPPEQGLQLAGSGTGSPLPDLSQRQPGAPAAAPRGAEGVWAEAHTAGEQGATQSGPWDAFVSGERGLARQAGDAQAMDVQMQGSQGLWGPQGQVQGRGQGGVPGELLSRSQRRDLWLSIHQQHQQQQRRQQSPVQAGHIPLLTERPGPQAFQHSGSYSPGPPPPGGIGTGSFSLGSLSSPEFPSDLHRAGRSPAPALALRGQQQPQVQRAQGASSARGSGQQGVAQHGPYARASQTEQQAALDTFNAVLALELSPRHFMVAQEGGEEEEEEAGVGRGGALLGGPQRPLSFQERGGRGPAHAPLAAKAGSEALLRSFSHGGESSRPRTRGPMGRGAESEPPSQALLFPHSAAVKREPSDSLLPPSPRSAAAGFAPTASPFGTGLSPFGDLRVQGPQGSPGPDFERSWHSSPPLGPESAGLPAGANRFADVGSSFQATLGGSGSGGSARNEGGLGPGRHSVVVKRQRMEGTSASETGEGAGASERKALWDISQFPASASLSMPERAQWPETPTDSPTQGQRHVVDHSRLFRDEQEASIQGLGARFAPGAGERALGSGTGSLQERAMGTGPGEPQQGELAASRQQHRLSGRLPPVWAPRRAHGSPSPLGAQEEHDLSLRLGSGFAGPGEGEEPQDEEEKGQGQDPMLETEPSAPPPAVTRWLMD